MLTDNKTTPDHATCPHAYVKVLGGETIRCTNCHYDIYVRPSWVKRGVLMKRDLV